MVFHISHKCNVIFHYSFDLEFVSNRADEVNETKELLSEL